MLKPDPEYVAKVAKEENATVITDMRAVRYILIGGTLVRPKADTVLTVDDIEEMVDGTLLPAFEDGQLVMLTKNDGGGSLIIAKDGDGE